MKQFFLVILLSVFVSVSSAQTTAEDWQKTDCDGNNYSLYEMTAAGNIVVMEFVMMNCSPCVTAAGLLRDVYNEFEKTHPGKVKIFSVSFNNTTTCTALKTWKLNAGVTWPVIANGKEMLTPYGEMGMPTIAVVGNNNQVLYSSIGFSSAKVDDIKSAISNGLTQSSVSSENAGEAGFSISPNPAKHSISIHTNAMMSAARYKMIDMKGTTVLEGAFTDSRDGNLQVRSGSSGTINISALASGTYTILLTTIEGYTYSSRFTITR